MNKIVYLLYHSGFYHYHNDLVLLGIFDTEEKARLAAETHRKPVPVEWSIPATSTMVFGKPKNSLPFDPCVANIDYYQIFKYEVQ